MDNTYFKHRRLRKYTRVARGQESGEIKSMIDLVLVRAVRGMGCGLSAHYVVLCKVRLVRAWIKRREVVMGRGGLEARN